jgi:hypothetical protein
MRAGLEIELKRCQVTGAAATGTGSGPWTQSGTDKAIIVLCRNFADGLHGNHRLKILTACNAPYPHSLAAGPILPARYRCQL